ncbi:hypothetical protein T484DRAFT_3203770 [Baffinella frigidus]|nr:hypothetical protein T484DRAFT_3203770 [Cryptophyta sp. CCMP2293]
MRSLPSSSRWFQNNREQSRTFERSGIENIRAISREPSSDHIRAITFEQSGDLLALHEEQFVGSRRLLDRHTLQVHLAYVGFGVWGLGLGVWGLGLGAWGFGFWVWGLGFGDWGLGFGVWGLGFGDWGVGIWDWGSGFGV